MLILMLVATVMFGFRISYYGKLNKEVMSREVVSKKEDKTVLLLLKLLEFLYGKSARNDHQIVKNRSGKLSRIKMLVFYFICLLSIVLITYFIGYFSIVSALILLFAIALFCIVYVAPQINNENMIGSRFYILGPATILILIIGFSAEMEMDTTDFFSVSVFLTYIFYGLIIEPIIKIRSEVKMHNEKDR